MIVGDGEAHQLVQRHRALGVNVEQAGRHRGQLQPLAHHGGRDEERGGDLLLAAALLAQRLEGAELVERMERLALGVLGEAVFLGEAVGADDAGHRRGLVHPLLLHQQFQRPETPATDRHLEQAGLLAPSSSTGRTVRLCSNECRTMLSASASIETPAFTRRTLA